MPQGSLKVTLDCGQLLTHIPKENIKDLLNLPECLAHLT